VSASPLPSGDDARRLELSHLYLTAPVRLNAGRRGAPGLPALHAATGGASIDRKGWLFAWMAYVETAADVPELSVWPAAGRCPAWRAAAPRLESVRRFLHHPPRAADPALVILAVVCVVVSFRIPGTPGHVVRVNGRRETQYPLGWQEDPRHRCGPAPAADGRDDRRHRPRGAGHDRVRPLGRGRRPREHARGERAVAQLARL
jgi:hypothetical protein